MASKNLLKVAVIQMKVTHDKAQNVQKACSFIKKACEKNANLVILPECFNSPYGTQYFKEYSELEDNSWTLNQLRTQLKESPCTLIAGSIPEKSKTDAEKCYNTSFTFDREGKIISKHRKVHLFDIDVPGKITFQESLTLNPGNSMTTFKYKDPEEAETSAEANVGVGICYDIRFPEMALSMRKKYNTNLLVYPGAFNMTTGPAHWDLLARARR